MRSGGSSSFLFTVVAVLSLTIYFVPGCDAQLRLEFCGSTEVPSLKCLMNPARFDLDVENRTLCFCVFIQGTIPTYNCLRADGKVTMEDLENLIGTIRNLTSMFPRPPIQRPENGDGGERPQRPNNQFGFVRDTFGLNREAPNYNKSPEEKSEVASKSDNHQSPPKPIPDMGRGMARTFFRV